MTKCSVRQDYSNWQPDAPAPRVNHRRSPRGSSLRLTLQFGEEGQGLERSQTIRIDRGDSLAKPVVSRRLKQTELLLRLRRRSGERRTAAARQLVPLECRQDLARAVDDGAWQARKAGDLNAVAAVGA